MSHKSVVHKHIAAALLILVGIYAATFYGFGFHAAGDGVSRLLLAGKLLGFLSLPLFVGIALTVHARYSDPELIKGYKAQNNEALAFLHTYNANTLEQLALQALSLVAFCVSVPANLLVFSLAQVVAFLVGRAMFFLGYKKDPMFRLVGFAVGYYPSAVAVFAACLFVIMRAA